MSDPENDKRQRRRMPLLYAVIGACVLITALSINAQAGNLLQLNFGNDTKIYFNDTESQINGTFLVNGSQVCTVASGCSGGGTDLNNYTTATSFTGNILSTSRNGASTLTATIPNNAITLACQNITGAASNLCTITGGGSSSGNLTMDSNVSGWPLQASNSTHITNLEVACDYASGYAIGRLSNNSVCFQTLLPATASATYLTITNAANTYTTITTANGLYTNQTNTQNNLNSLTSNYTTTVGYVNGLYFNLTNAQSYINSLTTNLTNTQNNLNSLTSNVTNLTNLIDLGATGSNSFRLNLSNGKDFNVTLSSGSGGANLVTLNSTNGTDAHNITLTWDNGTTFTTTINDQSGGSGISTFNATNGSTIVNSTTNAVVNITAGNNINVAVNDQGTFNISQLKLPQSVLLFDEWVDPYYGGSIEDGEAGMMGWNVVALGTGAGASMTSAQREPGRRGIMNLTTGSTNGGNVTVHLSVNMIYFNATSGKLIQFGGFNIGTTSGANNITYLMGFGDQTAGTAAAQNDTDAIWIAYNASGGNNNLSLITRSNSVQSENVTDIQVTAEQFYDYQLIVYNNTRVELYIDEQLKAILNTNIPSGNTRLLGPMQKLRKLGTNTGATAVMVGVDYYGIRYEFGEKK